MADTQQILQRLEERLDRIEHNLNELIEGLLAHGPLSNNPAGQKLSKRIRLGLLRRQAAHARAKKPVGRGKGAVGSPKTKRKLEREAK